MDNTGEALTSPAPRALKTVLRCARFDRSRAFYAGVLCLYQVEEWSEPQGRGCIFALEPGAAGCLEIYEMTPLDARFREAFTRPVANDKIDLQIRVDSVPAWVSRLCGRWPFDGPETLPWGQRWIKLRDPDGLLIALYDVP